MLNVRCYDLHTRLEVLWLISSFVFDSFFLLHPPPPIYFIQDQVKIIRASEPSIEIKLEAIESDELWQ